MIKYSELNARQKKAFKNIKWAANDLLGGLENTLLDNSKDSEEYISADNLLKDHNKLVKELYDSSISCYYDVGVCCFNSWAEAYLRDIRFCGKEFLMQLCEERITKEGY